MRSAIKEYDMFKAGEYIRDYSNTKMSFWRKFDQLEDEESKMELLRIWDRIRKKQDLELLVLILLYLFVGIVIGCLWTFAMFW